MEATDIGVQRQKQHQHHHHQQQQTQPPTRAQVQLSPSLPAPSKQPTAVKSQKQQHQDSTKEVRRDQGRTQVHKHKQVHRDVEMGSDDASGGGGQGTRNALVSLLVEKMSQIAAVAISIFISIIVSYFPMGSWLIAYIILIPPPLIVFARLRRFSGFDDARSDISCVMLFWSYWVATSYILYLTGGGNMEQRWWICVMVGLVAFSATFLARYVRYTSYLVLLNLLLPLIPMDSLGIFREHHAITVLRIMLYFGAFYVVEFLTNLSGVFVLAFTAWILYVWPWFWFFIIVEAIYLSFVYGWGSTERPMERYMNALRQTSDDGGDATGAGTDGGVVFDACGQGLPESDARKLRSVGASVKPQGRTARQSRHASSTSRHSGRSATRTTPLASSLSSSSIGSSPYYQNDSSVDLDQLINGGADSDRLIQELMLWTLGSPVQN